MNFYDNRARIDASLDRAVYKQIADVIRTQIESGEFAPGQRLPAVKDYVQEHYVSRVSVERALNVLRGEGLVDTDRSGSRVRRVADRTAVPLGEGSVYACMPAEPERRKYGIGQGVPVLVVTRGDTVEVYPADRVVVRGDLEPGDEDQPARKTGAWAWGEMEDRPVVGMPVTRSIAQRLGLPDGEATA